MKIITINRLRKLCCELENIEITRHLHIRFQERGIHIRDIIDDINYDTIIEEYPNDYPYPSCLVLGHTLNNAFLHVVCGVSKTKLWVITGYYPSEDKWESDYKTRRENM